MTARNATSKPDKLPRAVQKAKMMARARKLLGQGQTFEDVGKTLNIAPSGVDWLISEMHGEVPRTREEMRMREYLRLDFMAEDLMDQLNSGCDLSVIDKLLKVVDAQRKLMGLDRPKG